MADPACAFATDSASEFLSHLETAHPNAVGSGGEGLICPIDLLRMASPKCLVSHMVKAYGHCGYQCPYCFYRASSMVQLSIHQRVAHPGEKGRVVRCKSLPDGGTDVKLPTRVAFKPYKCRASPETCTFETVSQEELSRHLYMEHEVAESVDYQVRSLTSFFFCKRLLTKYIVLFLSVCFLVYPRGAFF